MVLNWSRQLGRPQQQLKWKLKLFRRNSNISWMFMHVHSVSITKKVLKQSKIIFCFGAMKMKSICRSLLQITGYLNAKREAWATHETKENSSNIALLSASHQVLEELSRQKGSKLRFVVLLQNMLPFALSVHIEQILEKKSPKRVQLSQEIQSQTLIFPTKNEILMFIP